MANHRKYNVERSDIRAAWLSAARDNRPKYEELDVEGLGKVFVKRLTAGERDAYEASGGKTHRRTQILVHFCFDERGARIFSEDDTNELEQLDPTLIDPVCECALRSNGYTKKEQDALLKNSNGQAVSS